MTQALRIGVGGLGTVGAGVIKIIHQHRDLLAARCGREIEVVAVSARDRLRDRGIDLDGLTWCDDPLDLARADDIDVVVELIGGSDGVAKALCETAIEAGKHVVTANKALLAHHGVALAGAAEEAGVALNYEAAIAGGIPIVKAMREGLVANQITSVYGILNGTCNYILTEMEGTGRDFEDVLKDAQTLGFAEADPTFDVDGIDAAHKLSLLAGLAFGSEVDFDSVITEGIRHITGLDIELAAEFGYRIKLLGIAERKEGGIDQQVRPCMVNLGSAIADVNGVTNAVVVEGDWVGDTVYEGPGAGEGPTASAVVADICDIARDLRVPVFGCPASKLAKPVPVVPESGDHEFYVRLSLVDKPGVMAMVTRYFADNGVSIARMIQRSVSPGQVVPVVLITHQVNEAALRRALDAIAENADSMAPPRMLRIETF